MRVALATAIAAFARDDDLAPLRAGFAHYGVQALPLAWDDPTISWGRFDAVLLRSTWDYVERLPEFLAWCERVGALTRLLNPLPVVRWNTDKHYLRDLANRRIPVVESHFFEPGAKRRKPLPDFEEFVVKPAIGAGSRDTQRYQRGERSAAEAHRRRLLDAGRSVLVQPYLHEVDALGETALVFFDGVYSHAIRKGPLLGRGAGPTDQLFAPEQISPREPSAAEYELAHRVLDALPAGPLAYARVDLLPSPQGPRLLELELTEPSLFFEHAPGSAERLAASVLTRLSA
jgi:glutathione synthase/RimK-type ligase-like ATP-grasp enzyme